MTHNVLFRYLFAALISAAAANNSLAGGKIIALAGETSGQMVALDDLGVLWAVRTDAKSLRDAKQIGQLRSEFSPVDLALFSAGGADYAVVTAASRARGMFPAWLYLFDITRGGKPQAVSLGPGTFTGVAYDRSRNGVLIAEARRLAVFEAAPIPSGSPQIRSLFGTITPMTTIGAVALDSVSHRLYCADPVGGTVYAVDLESGRHSLVAQ
jgi:hypothetical protein